MKLTRQEQEIENAIGRGEYIRASKAEIEEMARVLARRKKDAVLNLRINSYDLKALKQKAQRHGIKYQTFIAELLHRVAHN